MPKTPETWRFYIYKPASDKDRRRSPEVRGWGFGIWWTDLAWLIYLASGKGTKWSSCLLLYWSDEKQSIRWKNQLWVPYAYKHTSFSDRTGGINNSQIRIYLNSRNEVMLLTCLNLSIDLLTATTQSFIVGSFSLLLFRKYSLITWIWREDLLG